MNLQELTRLIAQGESERLELKKTTGQRTEAGRTVCAMLNGLGGHVIFGVDDQRSLVGFLVGKRTLEDVHHELARLDPPAFPDVETISLPNGHAVIVVSVHGGGGPFQFEQRSYLRAGPTTRTMPREEYERRLLEKLHGHTRWENQPAQGLSLAELDHAEVFRTIDEAIRRQRLDDPGTRDLEAMLVGLGVLRDGRLLNAAAVLFGKPSVFLSNYPQCVLRMARFDGFDKDRMTDGRQEQGNAFDLFVRAQRFMRDHLPVEGIVHPDQFEREDIPAYPTEALREALANALCHRDYAMHGGSIGLAVYDDRLEIDSAGPLPFGQTPQTLQLPHPSRPWNPLIAMAFYRRGIIEHWGRGTLKMASLMHGAGLTAPEIETTRSTVTVRFRRTAYVAPTRVGHSLSELQREILALLNRHGSIPLKKIRANLPEIPERLFEKPTLLRNWHSTKPEKPCFSGLQAVSFCPVFAFSNSL